MRWVYISLVMIFGSVASQQLYATNIWYLNMLCEHVARHVEAATHPGHTVLFASSLVWGSTWDLELGSCTVDSSGSEPGSFRMI